MDCWDHEYDNMKYDGKIRPCSFDEREEREKREERRDRNTEIGGEDVGCCGSRTGNRTCTCLHVSCVRVKISQRKCTNSCNEKELDEKLA